MKSITKTLVGTAVAGALVASSAAPAFARDHDDDGIRPGEVIAGALIIGGIAAIASSRDNYRDYGYRNDGYRDARAGYDDSYYRRDDRYYGDSDRYHNGGDSRRAVEQCVRAAERDAGRYSYGRADVTDIRDIRRTYRGYEVRGRIAVNAAGRYWRSGDRNYGGGWNGDYRGWNSNLRGYDSGTFRCKFERGRVTDIDYNGIRGLS